MNSANTLERSEGRYVRRMSVFPILEDVAFQVFVEGRFLSWWA